MTFNSLNNPKSYNREEMSKLISLVTIIGKSTIREVVGILWKTQLQHI